MSIFMEALSRAERISTINAESTCIGLYPSFEHLFLQFPRILNRYFYVLRYLMQLVVCACVIVFIFCHLCVEL